MRAMLLYQAERGMLGTEQLVTFKRIEQPSGWRQPLNNIKGFTPAEVGTDKLPSLGMTTAIENDPVAPTRRAAASPVLAASVLPEASGAIVEAAPTGCCEDAAPACSPT